MVGTLTGCWDNVMVISVPQSTNRLLHEIAVPYHCLTYINHCYFWWNLWIVGFNIYSVTQLCDFGIAYTLYPKIRPVSVLDDIHGYAWHRPNPLIPQCTCPIAHNVLFKPEMCTLLVWMVHCELWHRIIVGFVRIFIYFWKMMMMMMMMRQTGGTRARFLSPYLS